MTFIQIWFIITSIITITLLTVALVIGVRYSRWERRYKEFMKKFGIDSLDLQNIKNKYGVRTFDELSEIVEKRGIQTLAELDEITYYANTRQWELYDKAILNWVNNGKRNGAVGDESNVVAVENTKENAHTDVDTPPTV